MTATLSTDSPTGAAATPASAAARGRAVAMHREPAPPTTETVSVVIPAKNEAANLPWVLSRLPGGIDQLVLVDGVSSDDTIAVARSHFPDVVVVHETRAGKGAAI